MGDFSTRSAKRSSARERRQLIYAGNVQGVGFRYRTRTIAKGWDVTGYVRNLSDGQVEVLVEGSTSELDRFLNDVAQQLADHIRSVRTDVRPAMDDLPEFEIRF